MEWIVQEKNLLETKLQEASNAKNELEILRKNVEDKILNDGRLLFGK